MPTLVHLPALSPGMTEGKLVKWLKKEGDWVRKGEVLAEIETDKSVLELEAIAAGRLTQILVPEDTDAVAVDAPLAVLVQADEDAGTLVAVRALPELASASRSERASAPPSGPSATTESHVPHPGSRIFASPLARRMAAELGVSLNDITGTGPRGRIVKADVRHTLGASPAASYALVTNSRARKIIAKRMSEAKSSVPHFYLTIDCYVDALLALRKQLNERRGADNRVSINDFIIRAAALALRKAPGVNASWGEDAILLHHEVDIAVAVATTDGLVTPIIRKADTKGLSTIATEMRQLVDRARNRRLQPDEFKGGGFCVSNLGLHGVRQFTAIINPPHAAILAVAAAEVRPVVKDGEVAVATEMTCTLSCDHRVLDGVMGAEFLRSFRDLIRNPLSLL